MFRENSEAIEQCADNVGFRLLGVHCSNDRVVRFDVEVNCVAEVPGQTKKSSRKGSDLGSDGFC
jgi:hypothetical protein